MPGIKPECRSRHLTAPLPMRNLIELIFAGGNDPGQVRHLSPQDLATILADSVVLLQTPAVGRAY